MAKRIELIVENAGDVDRTAWPITQGIPFADGELERGDPVRVVNAKGQILPTQSMCTAAWSKNLSYIKWLLVDFQADLASGAKETFFLEYGAGGGRGPAGAGGLGGTRRRVLERRHRYASIAFSHAPGNAPSPRRRGVTIAGLSGGLPGQDGGRLARCVQRQSGTPIFIWWTKTVKFTIRVHPPQPLR